MSRSLQRGLAALGALALLGPAAAVAKPGGKGGHGGPPPHAKAKLDAKKGHGKGHTKPRTAVFRGTVVSSDSSLTLDVTGGNAAVRKGGFVGVPTTFDLSAARIKSTDHSNDGTVDAGDLRPGDSVLVKARLARGTAAGDGSAVIAALKVVNLTVAPAEGGTTPADEQ